MRLVQRVLLMLLALASARADYQYFYPCDLGAINCDAFPRHDYGDFGMSGSQATLTTPGGLRGSYSVNVIASNMLGEVIGLVDLEAGPPDPVYGFGGTVSMISQITDPIIPGPVDINNNGLYLFNDLGGNGQFLAWLDGATPINNLLDRSAIAAQLGVEGVDENPIGSYSFAYGINDQDQILVDLPIEADGRWQLVKGVLSPFAVPEPSTLLLLATTAAWLASRARR